MEASNEVKAAIIKQNIAQVENSIYDLSIKARVAEKIGDKEMKKNAGEQLEKLEKMVDEYNVILKELEPVDVSEAKKAMVQ
jgi:cob(I)alamin adenosyltransferase